MIIRPGRNLTYEQCLLVGIDPEFGKAYLKEEAVKLAPLFRAFS